MAKRKMQNRARWMRSRGLRVRPTLEILDDRVLLSANPIVTENQLPGTRPTRQSGWFLKARLIPASKGSRPTSASTWVRPSRSRSRTRRSIRTRSISIASATTAGMVRAWSRRSRRPQITNQPAPIHNTTTGEYDAGNWSVSASWAVPSTAVSGVYLADLVDAQDRGHEHDRLRGSQRREPLPDSLPDR